MGREPVLATEQVLLDEHEHAAGRFEMLLEELMRQHEAHALAWTHSPHDRESFGQRFRGRR